MLQRKTSRQQQILESLQSRINQCVPGTRLPSIRELMAHFGCYRLTIERVLDQLSEQQLIVRIPRKGIYAAPSTAKTIYMLTPCRPEVYKYNAAPFNYANQAAHQLGIELRPVPISATNRANELDCKSLSQIPPGANVIVDGGWYRTVFSYLNERRCQVALINSHGEWPPSIQKKISSWHKIATPYHNALLSAVKYLAGKGHRRILFVHHYQHINTPHWQSFIRALKQCGLSYDPRLALYLYLKSNPSYQMQSFMEYELKFDAAVVCGTQQAKVVYESFKKNPLYSQCPVICVRTQQDNTRISEDIITFGSNSNHCYVQAVEYLAGLQTNNESQLNKEFIL